jgi:hypothetical protein
MARKRLKLLKFNKNHYITVKMLEQVSLVQYVSNTAQNIIVTGKH